MNKASEPNAPIARPVDPTVRYFRLSLVSTAGLVGLFGVAWQQRGSWPFFAGVFISVSLFCGSAAMLSMIRARALTAPSTIRRWMRLAAAADVIFAVAIAGLTLWRWRA